VFLLSGTENLCGIFLEADTVSSVKKMVITAMLVALGIVLPMVFHMIPHGLAGRALLPMHVPVLLAGLIVGPFLGFFAGLITPLFSSMTTGMPAAGLSMYSMMIELSVYGAVSGLVMRYVHTRKIVLDLYISLIAAMLVGRIVAGLAQALLLFNGVYVIGLWVTSYFTTSLPGIILQILFVPTIVITLERGRLIPVRYPIAS